MMLTPDAHHTAEPRNQSPVAAPALTLDAVTKRPARLARDVVGRFLTSQD